MRVRFFIIHGLYGLCCCFSLNGCAMLSSWFSANKGEERPVISPPPVAVEYAPQPGAIYHEGSSTHLDLFGDRRAHDVGDIVTIVLQETTSASTTASTKTSKKSDEDTGNPKIAGKNFHLGPLNLLNTKITGNRGFNGSGNSNQSNNLNGRLAATVVKRLANGNLVIRGDKTLLLNQGNESVQLDGIIREADIAADNTVSSSLVADARISYNGRGPLANSNKMGFLSRFFQSPKYPY